MGSAKCFLVVAWKISYFYSRTLDKKIVPRGPACLAVKPLDLHVVNTGSIPTDPTHGEGRLQPHPGDVLKSTPNVRKSPRSGLNVEGRLSDPQVLQVKRLNR